MKSFSQALFETFSKKKKYITLNSNNCNDIEKDEEEIKDTIKYTVRNNRYKVVEILGDDINKEISCKNCSQTFEKKDIVKNKSMCPNCGHYFTMSARERINLLIDDGTFIETNSNLKSIDPLNFVEYKEKLEEAIEKMRMLDGVISGLGKINGIKVSIAVMDFNFMGGSMGSVVGEKITSTFELALQEKIPAIVVSSSGGARMQEGLFSLMQMAKTSAAIKKLNDAGIPFISVPVNPTMGGVTASFAMLGDIIVSEPDARIGFAGPRVIEQTIRQKLPANFQKSEFLLECGMIDMISKREDLKNNIYKIIKNLNF